MTAASNTATKLPVDNPRLDFQRVSFNFDRDSTRVRVLENISLQVADQEIVCVIGPSGAGKTTLLNLAAGFEVPTHGQVRVQGRTVQKPGPERCMIFQQYAIFPWLTVWKNIEFGLTLRARGKPKRERNKIVRHYIELMGLEGFERAYPKTLSGGMRQRVAIARGYAVSPEILLMDEPFGALDAQTRNHMQERLLDVMQEEGRSVLFITHSVEEAIYLGHRVVVLSSRPAQITAEFEVPFAHPREVTLKTSVEFNTMRRQIEELLDHQQLAPANEKL